MHNPGYPQVAPTLDYFLGFAKISFSREDAMDQVVILARGLGTRMRKSDPAVALDPALAAAADSGVKAMIPIGRPFLDYVLGVAADAGITRACLVVGPEHGAMQKYYTELRPWRMTIEFAVQAQPLGTADAVAAAEQVVGRRPFIVINSDNYYPLQALCGLRDAAGPAVAVFDQETLGGGKQHPGRADFEVLRGRGDHRGRRLPAFAANHREARRGHAGPLAATVGREHELLALRPGDFRGLPLGSSRRRGASWKFPTPCSMRPTGWASVLASCGARRAVLDLSSRNDIEPVARRLAGVKGLRLCKLLPHPMPLSRGKGY